MSQVSFQKKRRRTAPRDPTPAADSPTARRQRGTVTPSWSRSSPIDRGETSMGDYHSRRESTVEHRGEFTMEQNRVFPELQRWETASNGQRGKDSKQNCYMAAPLPRTFHRKRGQKAQKWQKWLISRPSGQNRGGSEHQDTNHAQWLIEPLNRVTFRNTNLCRGT